MTISAADHLVVWTVSLRWPAVTLLSQRWVGASERRRPASWEGEHLLMRFLESPGDLAGLSEARRRRPERVLRNSLKPGSQGRSIRPRLNPGENHFGVGVGDEVVVIFENCLSVFDDMMATRSVVTFIWRRSTSEISLRGFSKT